MKNFWFILVLLLIVVITVSLSSYKIETFAGYDYYNGDSYQSDDTYGMAGSTQDQTVPPPALNDSPEGPPSNDSAPSPQYYPEKSTYQPFVDKTSPQTPNDMTCYNYIKNIKGWNVDELSKDQLKVLLTMRALQGGQFSADSKVYPYGDGCVIPKEHFPIFNKAEEDLTPLTVRPSKTSNKNTCSNPNDNTPDRKPVNASVTLSATDVAEYPSGLKADFKKMNYDAFKDFLQGAYDLYDKEFLVDKKRLQDELKRQIKIRDWWNSYRQSLENSTKDYDNKRNALLRHDSNCQITTRGNHQVHMPDWNNKISQINNNIGLINRVWSYLWDGWVQIWNMNNC